MANRTIIVKGSGVHKEHQAAAAVSPGHLVEMASATTVQVHSTAAGNAVAAFARENEIFGSDVNTAYAVNDRVLYTVLPPGAEVYARVAAGATAIAVGDFLESAGDGTLRRVATSASTSQAQRASVVAQALEAVDNSGGASEAFIKVQIV